MEMKDKIESFDKKMFDVLVDAPCLDESVPHLHTFAIGSRLPFNIALSLANSYYQNFLHLHPLVKICDSEDAGNVMVLFTCPKYRIGSDEVASV